MKDILLTIESKTIKLYHMRKDPWAMNILLEMLESEIKVLTKLHDYLVKRGIDESTKINLSKYIVLKDLFVKKNKIEEWLKDTPEKSIDEDDYDDLNEYEDDLKIYDLVNSEHKLKKIELEQIETEIDELVGDITNENT